MNKIRFPNIHTFTQENLAVIFLRTRNSLKESKDNNLIFIINKLQENVESFFTDIKSPTYKFKRIEQDDEISEEQLFNLFQTIEDNINILYTESEQIRDSLIELHNYSAIKTNSLKNRIDSLYSNVIDLRILSEQQHEEMVVFTDSFIDDSNIDQSFALNYSACSPTPLHGGLTLSKLSASSIGTEEAAIEVSQSGTISREPNPTNVGRFYEGHFYDYLGSAVPEGGKFHIATLDNKDVSYTQDSFKVPTKPSDGSDAETLRYKKELRNFVVPGGFEEKFLEQVKSGIYNFKAGVNNDANKLNRFVAKQRRYFHRKDAKKRKQFLYYAMNPEEAEKSGFSLDTSPKTTIDDIVFVDIGGDDNELQKSRKAMLDNDPTTFWQCELVRDSSVIKDYIASLLSDKDEVQINPQDLKNLAGSEESDKEDFEVELIIKLYGPRILNWITITPAIFDDGVFPEVVELATARDDSSPFEKVTSFGKSASILTNDVNISISRDDKNYVHSESSFAFKGSGLWTMEARQVSRVKIRLRQKTPVPNPFERVSLNAVRTVTRVR